MKRMVFYDLTNERIDRLEAVLGEPTMDDNGIMYWPALERRNV